MIKNRSDVGRLHRCILCATCCWLAGCAGSFAVEEAKNSTPTFRNPKMSMQDALNAVVIGKSTQADVAAALGNAAVNKIDSGFEVWVYMVRSGERSANKSELVVLFAPSGVVKKIRTRPPV